MSPESHTRAEVQARMSGWLEGIDARAATFLTQVDGPPDPGITDYRQVAHAVLDVVRDVPPTPGRPLPAWAFESTPELAAGRFSDAGLTRGQLDLVDLFASWWTHRWLTTTTLEAYLYWNRWNSRRDGASGSWAVGVPSKGAYGIVVDVMNPWGLVVGVLKNGRDAEELIAGTYYRSIQYLPQYRSEGPGASSG